MKLFTTLLVVVAITACGTSNAIGKPHRDGSVSENTMDLGTFSVSLAVKDIAVSRAFYEKLGFEQVGGEQAQNWLIMRSGDTTVGLFQGMFEKNLMTFNPGWDRHAKPVAAFTDVRDLQKELKARGVPLTMEADESTSGPASVTLVDPDGNPILIDQHVPSSR